MTWTEIKFSSDLVVGQEERARGVGERGRGRERERNATETKFTEQ